MEIDKKEVAARLRIASRTLEQWVKDGYFPKPVYFGRRAFWARVQVDNWIAEKLNVQVIN